MPKGQPKQRTYKKLMIAITVVIGIGLIGILSYMWWQSATINYAQEAAKPIEEALVKAGAVKMCSNGDTGRGPDNRTPWLQDLYYLSGKKPQAEQLVYNIAATNGYKLNHASRDNRGPINVDDKFIDMWYYDYSSKTSTYERLAAGNISLAIIIDDTGKGYKCSDQLPDNTTVIGVDVKLPDYK